MIYRPLGKSGIKASVIAFGAWAVGGWMWGGAKEEESINAIHAAIDGGINFIDTAPVYGFGYSEEVVGKAIHDRRDKVVLATKCGLIWHKEEGEYYFSSDIDSTKKDVGEYNIYRSLNPKNIRYEIEQSLKRLKTDYIDLYQTHWQEHTTPIEDTMSELVKLKEEGKIRAIGCSNATPETMEIYSEYGQLDTDQERYSMLIRGHELKNLPHCIKNNIGFLAYSPLAQGLLTGKIGPEKVFQKGDQRSINATFSVDNRKVVNEMLGHMRPLAEDKGISISQLVLAWTFHQPGCSHLLVGARTVKQAEQNAKAGEVELTKDDDKFINSVLVEYHIEG